MSRPITEREKIILAFLSGFELGKTLTKEWDEARLIRQAGWKADMLMHPGSIIVCGGGQTFPASRLPAPPALERLPQSLTELPAQPPTDKDSQ